MSDGKDGGSICGFENWGLFVAPQEDFVAVNVAVVIQ